MTAIKYIVLALGIAVILFMGPLGIVWAVVT